MRGCDRLDLRFKTFPSVGSLSGKPMRLRGNATAEHLLAVGIRLVSRVSCRAVYPRILLLRLCRSHFVVKKRSDGIQTHIIRGIVLSGLFHIAVTGCNTCPALK